MYQLSDEERKKYIKGFVSIGGPWLGAAEPFSYIVGMDGFKIGPVELEVDEFFSNLPVLYALSPADTYLRFAESDWVKNTLKLREYYAGKTKEKPFKFMPDAERLCSKGRMESSRKDLDWQNQCTLGISDYQNLANVEGKLWKLDEIEEFLAKYGTTDYNADILWKNFGTYQEEAFPN